MINDALKVFQDGCNNHGIRTEHGQSPNQSFVAGILQLRESRMTALYTMTASTMTSMELEKKV